MNLQTLNSTPPTSFQRKILVSTPDFAVVACEWPEGHVSALHDHDFSQCFVYVQSGEFENLLENHITRQKILVRTGESITIPLATAHEFKCLSQGGGRTLHLYAPPLKIDAPVAQHFKIDSGLTSTDIGVGASTTWTALKELAEQIRVKSVTTSSPLFMNQLFSGVRPESILADSVISQTRTTMATQEASPIFSNIERELVKGLAKRMSWSTVEGLGVPGGSAGNFMAIHCARQIFYPQSKKEGHGARQLRIFVSDQCHYSFAKGCVALGLGTDALIKVASDDQGRMIPEELLAAVRRERHLGHSPLMVGATAGTTVMGAFDPIREISKICREESMWLHVDGAWGGPILFSTENRHLLDGIELADSLAFDAHKLLGATLTSTLFVTRHKNILREANDVVGADYLFHETECVDLGRMSWQCGRRADSFGFWLLWKSYGDQGFDELIRKLYTRRDEFIALLKGSDRFEIIHEPSFLNVCFKFRGDAQNDEHIVRLREALIEKNLAFVNYSQDAKHGKFFRMIFANPALTTQHIETLVDQLHSI